MTTNCFCGASTLFEFCCKPFIDGENNAPTAEKLMRSRYSAFATCAVDYLIRTTYSSERHYLSKADLLNWSIVNEWQKLEILQVTSTTVDFKAYYLDHLKIPQIHHELSTFVREERLWYYVDGNFS
jgi:SEC-C motif-containing protein